MKICLFCCLLLVSGTSLQAQGLIQYAFERLGKQAVRGCEKTAGLCTPSLLKAQQSAAERLQAAHLKRVLDKQAQKARQEYGNAVSGLRWSSVPNPTRVDEKELLPLVRAAAQTLHPDDPSARALSERWFKHHAHYAEIYARQKNGTPSDMLRYFTAKLYGDCLVNKAQCPAYQTLENILEQKYRNLDYKTCFKEDL